MFDLLNTSLNATTSVAEQRQREDLHDDIRGIRQEVLYNLWEKFQWNLFHCTDCRQTQALKPCPCIVSLYKVTAYVKVTSSALMCYQDTRALHVSLNPQHYHSEKCKQMYLYRVLCSKVFGGNKTMCGLYSMIIPLWRMSYQGRLCSFACYWYMFLQLFIKYMWNLLI